MGTNRRLNRIYWNMRTRCYDLKHPEYSHYGGRGITVCEAWLNKEHEPGTRQYTKGYAAFKKWAEDNGYAPDLTLDRIDNSKDYSPANCRWVTMKEQQNNRRNNRLITYKGLKCTISEWNSRLCFPRGLIEKRLLRGWSVEKALTVPPDYRHHKTKVIKVQEPEMPVF